MKLNRLIKKRILGGGNIIIGHAVDAIIKKSKTGKSYKACLKESCKETIAEDLPITSDIYRMGSRDGYKNGTIAQAQRDQEKMQQLHDQHEQDRKKWEKTDKEKDSFIGDLINHINKEK